MDKIILGLLMFQERTIYELKSRIEQGMNLMYSSSMGSIQAAIKKLLAQGCITFREEVERGKFKKYYAITDQGKAVFYGWVNQVMEPQAAKHAEMSKLYFMGLSDPATRKARIQEYIDACKDMCRILQLIYDEGAAREVPPEYADLFFYQFATAKYGLDRMQFEVDWYEKLLQRMNQEEG